MSLWSDGACCQTLSARGALAAIRRSAGAVDESWGCVADGSARRSFSRPRARLGLGDALNGGVHSLSTEIELIEDERVGDFTSMSRGWSAASGASRMFQVTSTWALALMAAANT